MIISHDIRSLFSTYLQPGQNWDSMTDDERKAQIWDRIPTVESSVQPAKPQVPVQIDHLAYSGRSSSSSSDSYSNYVQSELSSACTQFYFYKNDAENLKNAVLALQSREQLAQDPSLSADDREANSQYASVIHQWIVNQNAWVDKAGTSFSDHPELLLDLEHSGYTGESAQKATKYVLQYLSNMFSSVTPEEYGLNGFANMTSEQMLDALNQYDGVLKKFTDQISAQCGPVINPYESWEESPKEMDDWILRMFGKQYGLDPKYNPHSVTLTTDLTDPPKWMYHMFDSLDIKA